LRAGGDEPRIELAHGDGGERTALLVEELFARRLGRSSLQLDRDAALLDLPPGRLAFSTDSFVVRPYEFCGGNIGSLAVCGTVNDLAVSGARAAHLAVGFVLEEGVPIAAVERVVDAMAAQAERAGARVVTGDTKVVERGKGDGIYVHSTGVGRVECAAPPEPARVEPGDAVLVSGDVGRHGIAILTAREGLGFERPIESDCAPVVDAVFALLDAGIDVHCLRDPTRGGLATALVEIAEVARVELEVDAAAIPVRADVAAACEVLGLDPLLLACEGRFVAFVPGREAERALVLLARLDPGARRIGRAVARKSPGAVALRTEIGTLRPLSRLAGTPLPRIC